MMLSMSCPTARTLFEDYSQATIDLFKATRHELFEATAR